MTLKPDLREAQEKATKEASLLNQQGCIFPICSSDVAKTTTLKTFGNNTLAALHALFYLKSLKRNVNVDIVSHCPMVWVNPRLRLAARCGLKMINHTKKTSSGHIAQMFYITALSQYSNNQHKKKWLSYLIPQFFITV